MADVDLRRVFPIRRPAFPGARWLIGFAVLAVMLALFWSCDVFTPTSPEIGLERAPTELRTSWAAPLFFSVIIAYIVPVFGYISERTMQAVDALRPVLDADRALVDRWREGVCRKPVSWLATVLLIGAASGILHNVLLYGSFEAVLTFGLGTTASLANVVGTELTWIVVTTVVAALLDNAIMLARAARHSRVTLLEGHRLRPFATVAVISTLALIGAQAAFPIMGLESGIDAMAYIPGLLATGIPMVLIAALPIWPVHRRIAAAKHEALERVHRELGALDPPDPARPETLQAAAPLLVYRRELLLVSEWPFDVGVVTRLGLYLIIPPLTWVGAALIENVVNAVL